MLAAAVRDAALWSHRSRQRRRAVRHSLTNLRWTPMIITSGLGVSAGTPTGGQDAFGSADPPGRRPRCRIRQVAIFNPEYPRASGEVAGTSSPFPATQSSALVSFRCSSVPAAHGHGPASPVPAAPKRRER